MILWAYGYVNEEGYPTCLVDQPVAVQPMIFTDSGGFGICENCGRNDRGTQYWHDWSVECPMASAPDYCTNCIKLLGNPLDPHVCLRLDGPGAWPVRGAQDINYILHCIGED